MILLPLAPLHAPKRHCWECRSRRLVCDSAEPSCTACQEAGVECPGYNDRKRWLLPQKKIKGSPMKLSKGLAGSAERSAKSLDDLSRHVKVQLSKRYELRSEICDVGEAAHHYNLTIVPHMFPGSKAPNPFIIPQHPRDLPDAALHTLVVLALRHDIMRLSTTAAPHPRLQQHIYCSKGQAIESLNRDLSSPTTRVADDVFLSIFYFCALEVYFVLEPIWKPHFHALKTFIDLRGGIAALAGSSNEWGLKLYVFLICGTLNNATSPSSAQDLYLSQPEAMAVIEKVAEQGPYHLFPCPSRLILWVVRINQLRERTSRCPTEKEAMEGDVRHLVQEILEFPVQEWVDERDSYQEEWGLVVRLYHSAVILYAFNALVPAGLMQGMDESRSEHQKQLFRLLTDAADVRMLRYSLLWPSIVAGVEAARCGHVERSFVDDHLTKISETLGVFSPLAARNLFRSFWRSGRTGWDDCFNKKHMFLV